MKLVRGEAINWGAVKGLIGDDAAEVDSTDELERMLAMTDEPGQPAADGDWPLIDIERSATQEQREEIACLSAMADRHKAFEHITPGLWNHPLSLGDKSISQILFSLGFTQPQETATTPMGRIQGWPA